MKTNDKKDSGISEALSISQNQAINTNESSKDKTESKKCTQKGLVTNTDATLSLNKKSATASTKDSTKSTYRKRTNSACSNTSMGSFKGKANTSKQNQSQTTNNSQNIVKKTIAKVTAAFKTTKLGTASLNDASQLKLKTKAQTIQKKKTEHNGPLKVEYNNSNAIRTHNTDNNLNNSNTNAESSNVDNESNTSSSNRRCSSVPRTLKEKQAICKQITLGEKITNFFSRDNHKSSKSRLINIKIDQIINQYLF